MIFCAGFATAIYTTTDAGVTREQASSIESGTDIQAEITEPLISPQTARIINIGMHKCISYSKEAAVSIGEIIKEKISSNDNGEGWWSE